MTCIATDGKTMAGDGRIVADKSLILSERFRKVMRLDDGRVYGAAGDLASIVQGAKWLNAGADPDALPKMNDSYEGLVLDHDGQVWWFDNDCVLVPYDPPFAAGVGGMIALAAMRDGATPREAVEQAARNHATVGGEITELTPEKPKRSKR